jgi:hypothetical protein
VSTLIQYELDISDRLIHVCRSHLFQSIKLTHCRHKLVGSILESYKFLVSSSKFQQVKKKKKKILKKGQSVHRTLMEETQSESDSKFNLI